MTIYRPYWFALAFAAAFHLLMAWGIVLLGGSVKVWVLCVLSLLFILSFGAALSKPDEEDKDKAPSIVGLSVCHEPAHDHR
jgi:hypothetical protein